MEFAAGASDASRDLDEPDFSDLEAFAAAVKGARIVALGEASHGDGTAFELKARLVKFLHGRLGFDVLAFESGLLDCRQVDLAMSTSTDPAATARLGVYGIWSDAREMAPLWNYVRGTHATDRPLRIAGFDCKLTGMPPAEFATTVLDALDRAAPGLLTEAEKTDFRLLCKGLDYQDYHTNPGPRRWNLEVPRKLLAALESQGPSANAVERRFLKRSLESLLEMERWLDTVGRGERSSPVPNRDAIMAKNLLWLAREGFPGRKIVVWGHNYHLMNDLYTCTDDAAFEKLASDSSVGPMLRFVKHELGDSLYSVGFTCGGGVHGTTKTRPEPVATPAADSIEGSLMSTVAESRFIDFRSLAADDWLRGFRVGYFYFHEPAKTRWPKIFDGMIFQREMRPATRLSVTPSSP
jgi:erythromycin esterase